MSWLGGSKNILTDSKIRLFLLVTRILRVNLLLSEYGHSMFVLTQKSQLYS